jgi:uncharacterized protein with HEPN domain
LPSEKTRRRLVDIVENARAIEQYVSGLDMAGLLVDRRTRDAIERCLERVSEAARRLGPLGPKLLPDQPWHEIRAIGNRLRHEYDRVRIDRIWDIVKGDLPALREACETALAVA